MTPMPTVIDLEGNEQPTYDIAEELEKDSQKRPKPVPQDKEGGDE